LVQPTHEAIAVQPQLTAQAAAEAAAKIDNLITIKSPMIGTFYKRPSPDKPNFVESVMKLLPGKWFAL
jgi:acetyl-CoA carboxylase biotin carboxyl carrier protein